MPQQRKQPDEVTALLADLTQEWTYADGEALYRENEPATHIHLIVSGAVRVVRRGHTVRELSAGGVVGGPAVLSDSNGYDAFAVGRTLTLRLAREDVEEIWEDHFQLMSATLANLSRELLELRRQLPGAGFRGPACSWPPT